ncbi:MAG: hypothetical protein AAF203_08825, partial [Pseudomonadota bacterium]
RRKLIPSQYTRISKPWLLIFLSIWSFFFLWWLGQYPGFFNFDTLQLLQIIKDGKLSPWHSIPYSALTSLFWNLQGDLALLGLFQLSLFSFLLSSLFFAFWKSTESLTLTASFLLLFFLSPLHGAYSLAYNRDPLYSWLFIAFLAQLFFLQIQKPQSNKNPWTFGFSFFLVGLLCLLRLETMIILPIITLGLALKRWSLQPRRDSLVLLGSLFLFLVLIPWALKTPLSTPRYGLTAYVNPLSFILNESPEDQQRTILANYESRIAPVIPIQMLKDHYDPFEIPAFHRIPKDQNPTAQEWSDFQKATLAIIASSPELYLRNRFSVFQRMMGLGEQQPYLNDALPLEKRGNAMEGLIVKKPLIPSLGAWQKRLLLNLEQRDFGRFFHWGIGSSMGGLLFLLLGLCLFKKRPAFFWICLILGSRTLVVFLTAPASQFKYLYSLYLFGFIAPMLLIIEGKNLRKIET